MEEAYALLRPPADSYICCTSAQPDRLSIDVERARRQHTELVRLLGSLVTGVTVLPPLEDFPDSCFIEDMAVILDGKAVICRPRIVDRRGEGLSIAGVLKHWGMTMSSISEPATIEGGDVIVTSETLFIGKGTRTNEQGVVQFLRLLGHYPARIVDRFESLHLKSVATYIGRNTFVVDPRKVDVQAFHGFTIIAVEPEESFAANCIGINGSVIVPAGFPRIVRDLTSRHFPVYPVEIDEFRKGDGSLTCLSIVWGVQR